MINWKYVRAQYQGTWIIILLFGFVLTILIALMNFNSSMAFETVLNPDGSMFGQSGGEAIFNILIFGIGPMIIFLGFGITMNAILVHREINRGYITSWLTTPISRNSLFNSKLFVLITSTLIINFWMILFEVITFSIRMGDFNLFIGYLLLGNLVLIFYSLMIVAGTWFIYSLFQKNILILGILLGLGGWFVLCYALNLMAENDETLKNLKYFKYFTIQSLFNSPFQYVKNEYNPGGGWWIRVPGFTPLLPLKALNYAWQVPVMVVAFTGFFVGGQIVIKKKDFAF